ncbi:4754_t:CDS:2, partial [Cetraspora pellucida]
EKLKAEEAGEILRVIEESGMERSEEEWLKGMKFNRNLLLQYLQERKKEEKVVRKKSQRIKDIKSNLKKYGLKTEPIKEKDLEKWDKEKKKDKNKPQTFSIVLPVPLYQQLLQEVGKGNISKFVKKAIQKELKKTDKQSLKAAYQALENFRLQEKLGEEKYEVLKERVFLKDEKLVLSLRILEEQNEISRRVMVIPLTSSKKLPPTPFHVSLVFQNKLAKILPEQMRVADKSRIKGKYLGRVSWEVLREVEEALHIVLDLRN